MEFSLGTFCDDSKNDTFCSVVQFIIIFTLNKLIWVVSSIQILFLNKYLKIISNVYCVYYNIIIS